MNFQNLQDELRVHIRARIGRGELTGSGLARAAGFPQGHLSNFLNSRRGLSLESMDRLLTTLRMTALDLVPAQQLERHDPSRTRQPVQAVPLVATSDALRPRFAATHVIETREFPKSFLRRLPPRDNPERRDWIRFVTIRFDASQTCTLLPFAATPAVLLLDRHCNSLKPSRRARLTYYAASIAGRCVAGQVAIFGDRLVVRPSDPRCELEAGTIERGREGSDFVIGRVCHIALEL